MASAAGSRAGVGELVAVLGAGVVLLVAAVLVGPGSSADPQGADRTAVPRSDLYAGPDAERRPLDRRIVFSDVPEGWGEDVPSRTFAGLGDETATVTTFFTDADGDTGDDAVPEVFVCLTYANADTCTIEGPQLITTRTVGNGVLMKITGLEQNDDGTPARQLDAEQRRVWRDALSVRFTK